MKKEADVKREVKKILDDLGAWWFMPVPVGYGKQGVPDFIVCLNTRFIAIETKYGSNKLTAWQERQIDGIDTAGGWTFVINERNIDGLKPALQAICQL
ncbi:MAG: hypothetical protein EA406_05505 [Rhodospirillales bacterium]|nr:MAG: hypothetical protein EA406_05505 [Rhodospirillales bacterium]